MESPIDPALANVFVRFYETTLSNNANKPHTHHHYDDNTFEAFNSEKECDNFVIFSQLLSSLFIVHFCKKM